MLTRCIYSGLLLVCLLWVSIAHAAVDVRTVGLVGDGQTDDTEALQKAIDALPQTGGEFTFSKGIFLIGTVNVPSNVTLRGEGGALIRINTDKLQAYNPDQKAGQRNPRCLFALKGNDIQLQDLAFDFLHMSNDLPAEKCPDALIVGMDCTHVSLSRLSALRPEPMPAIPYEQRKTRGVGSFIYDRPIDDIPPAKQWFDLAYFEDSEDVLLEDSRATFMNCMLKVYQCTRVVSQNNWAMFGTAITSSRHGTQYLRHTGNWSRSVRYQCRWSGGNANDKRKLKPEKVGWGTGKTVIRGSRDTDENYNPYTAGVYDILVANNYAEYGQTLAWGAKGRQVTFQGNTGRFFSDYALGSEGGENVIFIGNTVINSYSGGIVSMYWSEKLTITGNIAITRDEPFDKAYSAFSSPTVYQGNLLRLHSAASSSGSGAGQVVITGNVLSCEIPGQSRRAVIQGGRNVLMQGNTLHNARIFKKNQGKLSVIDNQFTMTLPGDIPWIEIEGRTDFAAIRNNIFVGPDMADRSQQTNPLMLIETGGKKTEDTTPVRIIENNIASGFPIALWLRTMDQPGSTRLLVQNNTVDGMIRVEGLDNKRAVHISGNLNYDTFKPISPQLLLQAPKPMPERKHSDDDSDLDENQRDEDSESMR